MKAMCLRLSFSLPSTEQLGPVTCELTLPHSSSPPASVITSPPPPHWSTLLWKSLYVEGRGAVSCQPIGSREEVCLQISGSRFVFVKNSARQWSDKGGGLCAGKSTTAGFGLRNGFICLVQFFTICSVCVHSSPKFNCAFSYCIKNLLWHHVQYTPQHTHTGIQSMFV